MQHWIRRELEKKKKTQTWQFILQILLNDDVNPKLIWWIF